jgi:hypothetical protein
MNLRTNFKVKRCGKIGYLPNEQMHVGARVSGSNLCEDIN